MITRLILAAFAASVANAAIADPLFVWNSVGTNVGTLMPVDNALVRRFSDGAYRFISIGHQSLAEDAVFFYTRPNCAGQRYLDATFYYPLEPLNERQTPLAGFAMFEDEPSPGTPPSSGQSIWGYAANAPVQSVTYVSYWVDDASNETGDKPVCTNISPSTGTLIAAIRLDGNLAPPFCAWPSRVVCKP